MNVRSISHLPQFLRPAPDAARRDEPITVTVARTVLPDKPAGLRGLGRWHSGTDVGLPRDLGSTLLSPGPAEDENHIVYRFADAETLHNWVHSARSGRSGWPSSRRWSRASFAHVTGLETWFSLPDRAGERPPRWKMVAVASTVIFAPRLPIQAARSAAHDRELAGLEVRAPPSR